MAILAFGTTLSEMHFEGLHDTEHFGTTVSTAAIAPYVVEGIFIKLRGPETSSTDSMGFTLSTPSSDFWVSFHTYGIISTSGNDRPPMEVFGNGKGLFRLMPTNGLFVIQYHNDTSYQTSGTSFGPLLDNTIIRWDFHVVIHDTTGTLTVYINGNEQTSTTFSAGDTLLRGESVADEVRFAAPENINVGSYLSACFVSDTDSRIIHYVQRVLDGAGTETDWVGAYTDIDEVGIDPDDFIQSGTTTEKATYTFAALPAALNTGFDVVGVGVSARAAKGSASGPSNLQLAVRENVTNGFSSSKALSDFWAPYQHMFPLNPDTTSAWTFAEADAAEVGVQAIT